ncbi:hypothetical protein ACIPLC_16770 [Kitasatospora sp. NPDC086801]|uniref:hypothetical protein n=1 Tax=Kitasatospora sp. NPDC086801 TaxID=3364066 RepID=UPI003807625C
MEAEAAAVLRRSEFDEMAERLLVLQAELRLHMDQYDSVRPGFRLRRAQDRVLRPVPQHPGTAERPFVPPQRAPMSSAPQGLGSAAAAGDVAPEPRARLVWLLPVGWFALTVFLRFGRRIAGLPWVEVTVRLVAVVELADDLAARGVAVLMAVAQNWCRAVETERGTKAEYFGRDQGHFVVVQGLGCLIRVSSKPLSGWSASVRADEGGVWQRLDLGGLLFGELSVVPGVEPGRVDRAKLAEVIADLARLPRVPTVAERSVGWDSLPAQRSQAAGPPARSVLVEGAARELARMGFADVVPDGTCSRVESETFRVEWWNRSKSMGLGDVQRLYGAAVVEGRRLMVVSESFATKPACAFADQAKAFVFVVDPEGRRLHSCNDLAREVVLDRSSWSPARGLVDRWLG